MFKLVLSFKGMELKQFPLAPGSALVGSDPDCDIHVDSLAINPRHAILIVTDAAVSVRDLATDEGTFVNEEKVSGERELKVGDQIRVGKHDLRLEEGEVEQPEAPAAPATAAASLAADDDVLPDPSPEGAEEPSLPGSQRPKSAWLQILSGQNVGKTIGLSRKLTNLGKPGVQTAIIAHRNEGYFISHLEGEHPPRVGGASIGDRSCQLKDGDIIQIGNVKMQFYLQ